MVFLADWAAVVAHLRESYADRVALVDETVTIMASELAPAMTLTPIDVAGARWLELACRIGDMRSIGPRSALVLNAGLAVGAICAPDGRLLLRQLLPLGLAPIDLDDALATFEEQSTLLIAQIAQTLRNNP